MKQFRIILICLAVLAVVYLGPGMIFKWSAERVFVGPDEALMVINKFGDPLPSDMIVVPADNNHFKGVQEELRGPGRYFLNPVEYDWQIVPLVEIPAGDPEQWAWDDTGKIKDSSTLPKIGIVTLKQGRTAPPGMEVVDRGYKGVQKEVLTPGTYKINPQEYEVTLADAVVVPPGSVGVVTRLVGDAGTVDYAPAAPGAATQPDDSSVSRLVVGPNQRGILKDVLQPGIYYLNPRMAMVTMVTVGYDAISLDHTTGTGVTFYSSDGYQVEADFTVVWGRTPQDAPNIVSRIGGIDRVRENVIEPAMKAACQNEGGRYSAKQLIQGSTRSEFQDALSTSLEQQVHSRNLHILLALIRNIAIKDTSGNDATGGLLATIQQANIEREMDLTNQQKTTTAATQAQLEQTLKLVDVARETVTSETGVKVANIAADGAKQAAEIEAQQELDIATIDLQVAKLEAQRTQILGKAQADVTRLKNDAEAAGNKMLIDAFGSPQAYNLYTFAQNFAPTELRLIFAGNGTFWTDLKTFQDIGGANQIIQEQGKKDAPQ
jgi:SPFH domain / Band 7 family